MNFVEPRKLPYRDYKELIDAICAQAYMENMEVDPEDRGDMTDEIEEILREMYRNDEDTVLALYNTMRGEDTFKFRPWRRSFGYVYRADDDFFDGYYEGCCPSEIAKDISNEDFQEEEFVAIGHEVNSSYSLYFENDLRSFFDIDEFAESVRDKWLDMHQGDEDAGKD